MARDAGRLPTVPAEAARRLLLEGCALAAAPARSSSRQVLATVRKLGFVQVDSISSVERAHHLIMHARLDGYRPEQLAHHCEQARSLFEHWTHDASLIRRDWLGWWTLRFERYRRRSLRSRWMRERLGDDWKRSTREVLRALDRFGPLGLREMHERLGGRSTRATGWWDWSPHKAALEHLWRTGDVAIHSRRGFEKIYVIASQVHGDPPAPPCPRAHVEWACGAALERLGAATCREIAGYLGAIAPADAQAWCKAAVAEGRIQEVRLDRLGRDARPGFAVRRWKTIAARRGSDPTPRLLAPFDPLIRDRDRALELFGLDYRFEAFVPAARRSYGYYVMPVLVGERFVARLDLASDRESGRLRIDRAWAEPGVGRGEARRLAQAAAERLAAQLALRIDWRARRTGVAAPLPEARPAVAARHASGGLVDRVVDESIASRRHRR